MKMTNNCTIERVKMSSESHERMIEDREKLMVEIGVKMLPNVW